MDKNVLKIKKKLAQKQADYERYVDMVKKDRCDRIADFNRIYCIGWIHALNWMLKELFKK